MKKYENLLRKTQQVFSGYLIVVGICHVCSGTAGNENSGNHVTAEEDAAVNFPVTPPAAKGRGGDIDFGNPGHDG